jgi:hypothetical protein
VASKEVASARFWRDTIKLRGLPKASTTASPVKAGVRHQVNGLGYGKTVEDV